MDHLQENIRLAVDLSRQIVDLAQQQDWPQMERLDQERMQLLKEIFSEQSLDSEESGIKQQLQSIVDLNDQAVGICSQVKDSMLTDGRKLRRGKEAILAYKEQAP
ncbi:MAG: flagellar protein FliT [Gammaproteobacteria bacterium]|nr:flagellar protein FliT [Gammaproteobacteria bacterium]